MLRKDFDKIMCMNKPFFRWFPSILMMVIIYAFSSTPSYDMPDFGILDLLAKKSGHVIVYALLGWSFFYALGMKAKHAWLAILLSVLYAISDEIHQSFVPGRNAWWIDVAIDSIAATLAVWIAMRRKTKSDRW
jgi:VanZ family protein